jgi:hypothetical protein
VGAVLAESLRLFGSQLHLLTLLSLTVWLPAHVLLGYLEYFEPDPATPERVLRIGYLFQVVFEPLVVAATLCALSAVRQGLPVSWGTAMADGARSWGRLMVVRFLIFLAMMVPTGAAFILLRGGDPVRLLLALALVLFALAVAVVLLRVAVVDAVVVLEGGTVTTAWRRASALTAGRRRQILGVVVVMFVLVGGPALAVGWVVHVVPSLDHFVPRVLAASALSVLQSLFTVAFFLFYLRAVTGERPAPPASPDAA